MKCKKYEFKGKFGIDGFYGGDTYPYWLVSKDTYEKIKGESSAKEAEQIGSSYKLYLSSLIDYKNEGKKQTISLRIVTE